MLSADEARALGAECDAKRTEEIKKQAEEMLNQLSDAIAKEAAKGKHSLNCVWNTARWGSLEAMFFGEKVIRAAGYKINIDENTCLIAW